MQFSRGATRVQAVDGVDLDVRPGRVLGIVGESGSGKSTLAHAILQLVSPPGEITGGEILLDDVDLLRMSESDMRQVRGRRIALVLQNPATSLNPTMTVGQHLTEVIRTHVDVGKREATASAIEALRQVRLGDQEYLLGKYPHELSGGMKQRVMIALGTVSRPQVLIADEPTSALDVATQADILRLLRQLNTELGTTVIVITHNLGVAAEICDDVAVMYAGRIMETADVLSLHDTPAHPYTQGLLAAVPDIEEDALPVAIPGEAAGSGRVSCGCVFQPRCSRSMEVCTVTTPRGVLLPGSRTAYCFLYERDDRA